MSDHLPEDLDLLIEEPDDGLPDLPDFPGEALDMPPALLLALALLAALAALALVARWLAQRRRRRIEAGNKALAVLAQQQACFAATRAAFHDTPADPAPPTFDPVAPQLHSLSFLLDAQGIPAVLRLIEAQQRHGRLAELVRTLRDSRNDAERAQQAAAARRNLGEALAADDGVYEVAFRLLRGELVRRFGERFPQRPDAGG